MRLPWVPIAAVVGILAACGETVAVQGAGTRNSGAGGATSSSSSTSTSSGTGGGCAVDDDCGGCGISCCAGHCVNQANDIFNCGGCGKSCDGPHPHCEWSKCSLPQCSAPPDGGVACGGDPSLCCGYSSNCCAPDELCCKVQIGTPQFGCIPATPGATCALGAPCSKCASPDTPIATPSGERPIAELAAGDLVYSVRAGAIETVPILRVSKLPAHDHHVVHVLLDTGAVLEISPLHPTADGRTFGELRPGDRLDGARVVEARLVPYVHAFTYDILPASDTGTYVAGGALIGSTLHGSVIAGR